MLRYAVLEHRWDGIHWDFLLEDGAVLRTWSLSAEPAPGVTIAAAPRPDHRLVYLDYEGPISGGRGEVRRVDAGRYVTEVWEEGRVVVRLEGGRWPGRARFERSGGNDPQRGWTFSLEPASGPGAGKSRSGQS